MEMRSNQGGQSIHQLLLKRRSLAPVNTRLSKRASEGFSPALKLSVQIRSLSGTLDSGSSLPEVLLPSMHSSVTSSGPK